MSTLKIIKPEVSENTSSPSSKYIETEAKLIERSLKLIVDEKSGTFHEVPANILYVSSHGLGKTLLVATLREELSTMMGYQIPMVTIDCSQEWKEYKMKGSVMGVGGETPFVLGAVTGAIEMANEVGCCILDIEEINGLPPGAQKMLNGLTDWRRSVYVELLAKKFELKPDTRLIILATMNPSGYGGVFSLNPDLRSRFSEFQIKYPTPKDEGNILKSLHPNVAVSVVDRLITLAAEIREKRTAFSYEIGTRDLSRLLDNYTKTDDLELALEIDLANKFDGTERGTVVDRINAHFKTAGLAE